MSLSDLKRAVWHANRAIVDAGLVVLTWGNASGVDREAGVLVIKPSGVAYDDLSPDDMVAVDLETGEPEGDLRPSSDTPTHLHLVREFPQIGGVVHTHSAKAVAWAQAEREIPCLGTTHADHFHGPVLVTRRLTGVEIRNAYEHHTGSAIAERVRQAGPDALTVPAALVAGHGPFAWGPTVEEAVDNAIALEAVAAMALDTLALRADCAPLDRALHDTHFLRKHGPGAYYGQTAKTPTSPHRLGDAADAGPLPPPHRP